MTCDKPLLLLTEEDFEDLEVPPDPEPAPRPDAYSKPPQLLRVILKDEVE